MGLYSTQYSVVSFFTKEHLGSGEMALWVRVIPIKPDSLSLISAFCMVRRENQLLQVLNVQMYAVVPMCLSQ